MHFAVIADSVPHTYHGGGGVTAYSALRAMLLRGDRVSVLALASSPYNGPKTEADHVRHLEDLGVSVCILEKEPDRPLPPRGIRRYFPAFEEIFPAVRRGPEVKAYLREAGVDGAFLYHWQPIAATLGTRGIPKLGLVGDPIHLPALFRKTIYARYEEDAGLKRRLKESLFDRYRTRVSLKGMERLLRSCDASGAFAAHHAEMFRAMGIPKHGYFRTPTPDPLVDGVRKRPADKSKIMHIGHLRGTATLSGVELIAMEILPRLKAALPLDSFEIHLVGGYFETLPEDLKARLIDPAVKVRGQISPSDEEFLSSHIVLVPTPIELGIRVRIITAFSFGSCIVAHTANRAGIPELESGRNCLLGGDGKSLADHCVALLSDPGRRASLEEGARRTYDDAFSLGTAGAAIAERLAALVGPRAL